MSNTESIIHNDLRMFQKVATASLGFVASVLLPLKAFAAVDLTTFNDALATGTDALVSMVGAFGLKGILVVVALIAAAIVIYFIKYGFHSGKKAMSGKV